MHESTDNIENDADACDGIDHHQQQQPTPANGAAESRDTQHSSNSEEVICVPAIECEPIVASSEPYDSANLQTLASEIDELRKNNGQYGSLLRQRDDAIELQRKELALLEAEKEALRRDYETGRKEKEQAVVRYAMLEKSIIDATAAKEALARKLRDAQKEADGVTGRLKLVTGERDKAHKEIRDFLRESEQLKYHMQSMETQLKWSQRNLTVEKGTKAELERKLAEVTAQMNEVTEQRQHQIDTERKSEQEQDAQLIMLKHAADAKERALGQVQKAYDELKSEFAVLFERKEHLAKELDVERQRCADIERQMGDLSMARDEQTLALDELRGQRDALEGRVAECTAENGRLTGAVGKLNHIEDSYREQSEEMAAIRAKEDEYLALLKDLTEKCVLAENKLTLANSKASALQLDNERLHKDHKVTAKQIHDADEQMAKMRHKHSDEIKLFNRILADEKGRAATVQSQLDDLAGDLEATRNKHSQTVKELNRELAMLRKGASHASPSADSGFGTDTENRGNGDEAGHDGLANGGEPTKKALIDRIVKLQRQLAKQTEKIEFLENHCVALFNELKTKSS